MNTIWTTHAGNPASRPPTEQNSVAKSIKDIYAREMNAVASCRHKRLHARHSSMRFVVAQHTVTQSKKHVRQESSDLHHCPKASQCGPRSTPHKESGGPGGCLCEHGDTYGLKPIQLGRPTNHERIGLHDTDTEHVRQLAEASLHPCFAR